MEGICKNFFLVLGIALLTVSCSYDYVPIKGNDIKEILDKIHPGKEYEFELRDWRTFSYGDSQHKRQLVQLKEVTVNETCVKGMLYWHVRGKKFEQLDSIPRSEIILVKERKTETGRTALMIIGIPIFVGVVVLLIFAKYIYHP